MKKSKVKFLNDPRSKLPPLTAEYMGNSIAGSLEHALHTALKNAVDLAELNPDQERIQRIKVLAVALNKQVKAL